MTSHNTEHLDRDYIKTLPDQAKADLNADPITGEPGSHPVGTGVGTTAGAIAGAAVGSLGGPIGAAIGGVAGAIAGAAAGHKTLSVSARYTHLNPKHTQSVVDRISSAATQKKP